MTLPVPRKSTAMHLYKYSNADHLEWLRDILLQNELYLPNLKELNDDNDGLPRLAMQTEDEMVSFLWASVVDPNMSHNEFHQNKLILRETVRKHGHKALHPQVVEFMDAQLRDFRIYSMTKRYDMPNLWASYAGDHSGYCLEFKNVGDLFEHARDVSYLDSDQMEVLITGPALRNGDFFFCKTRDWSDEDEVRLVLNHKDGRKKVKFDPRWLTRIILGKKMSDEHRNQIREWAKQRETELTVVDAYYDPTQRAIKLRKP